MTGRLIAVLVGAVLVAVAAVELMRPRDTTPAPAPVEARQYFSERQIDRAEAFRGPQLALYGGSVAVGLAALILLVRRPPRLVRRAWGRPVLAGAGVAAGVSLVAGLAPLPVGAISRQRAIDVGLSTRSWPGWAYDVAVAELIAAAIAALGGAALVWALRRFGRRWWIPGATGAVLFAIAITYLSPVLVEPRFNTFTPVPEGPLRTDVLRLADRAGVDVGEVYVVDASLRTTGANAYVAGLGSTKRVVLYDTLVEDFPPEEVRLVVAHELGHVRFSDVPRGLLWVALVAPLGMLAIARLAERFAGGAERVRERPAAAVPAVALAIALVVPAITAVSNDLSRDVEARADRYSLELTRAPETLVAFQRRIALANVSDPDPPGWATALLGTHPPTLERIGIALGYRVSLEPATGRGAAGRAGSRGGS